MELDYKIIIWILTVVTVFYGYGKYIIDTINGKTKPHVYSWIVFTILASISFLIQYNDGAWPWAWALWSSTITTFIIAILAFFYGTRNITTSDTISFVFALLSIIVYVTISEPIYALVFVILITIGAFYPTFRKTYYAPWEETLIAYILAGSRTFVSLFAIYHFSVLTVAYPVTLVLINLSFVILVLVRKKQLGIY